MTRKCANLPLGPKSYLTWPFEKRAPWSAHYAINNNDRSSENTFCFKIYRQSVFFFFFSSTELHEVNNNYDTNLLKQTYQLLGMARYHISWSLRQISMAVAPGEKSYFLFAKRRATVLPIYFHFLWATDVTNIIGMRTN